MMNLIASFQTNQGNDFITQGARSTLTVTSVTIALASGRAYQRIDVDLPLIVDAAAARGLDAEIAVWDDDVDWSAYDVVLVRSCWDYLDRRADFLAWAATVPNVLNPADVLTWNTDKVYLRELADAGVPVIDTRWDVRRGDDLPDSAGEWVVKPSISGGGKDTARWGDPDDVFAHSEELIAAGRTAMVQPYVPSVDSEGETALIYFGGRFSHAIRKGPLLERGEGVRQDRDQREVISPRAPTAAQEEVAQQVLAAIPSSLGRADALAYARVDLVTDTDGVPRLIELELTEPSLFLDHAEGGAERLLDVLAR
jgi:glutathione synthase/RimK-type ligase-like ATP-grasp enzyme